jgi:hypothetical protein
VLGRNVEHLKLKYYTTALRQFKSLVLNKPLIVFFFLRPVNHQSNISRFPSFVDSFTIIFQIWTVSGDLGGVFGLKNELAPQLFISLFFVWFVGWNRMMRHHLVPHKLIISTGMRNEAIPPNLRNQLMMHHLI